MPNAKPAPQLPGACAAPPAADALALLEAFGLEPQERAQLADAAAGAALLERRIEEGLAALQREDTP